MQTAVSTQTKFLTSALERASRVLSVTLEPWQRRPHPSLWSQLPKLSSHTNFLFKHAQLPPACQPCLCSLDRAPCAVSANCSRDLGSHGACPGKPRVRSETPGPHLGAVTAKAIIHLYLSTITESLNLAQGTSCACPTRLRTPGARQRARRTVGIRSAHAK